MLRSLYMGEFVFGMINLEVVDMSTLFGSNGVPSL